MNNYYIESIKEIFKQESFNLDKNKLMSMPFSIRTNGVGTILKYLRKKEEKKKKKENDVLLKIINGMILTNSEDNELTNVYEQQMVIQKQLYDLFCFLRNVYVSDDIFKDVTIKKNVNTIAYKKVKYIEYNNKVYMKIKSDIANCNLLFNKFKYIYMCVNKDKNEEQEHYKFSSEKVEEMLSYIDRKQKSKIQTYANLNEYKVILLKFENESKLAIGLGEMAIDDVGIKLDHIYGVPFIPASSLKGAFRKYIEEKFISRDNLIEALFGTEDKKGALIFFDSYPEKFQIKEDIVSEHYKEYYSGVKAPSDFAKLDIVKFPVIKEKSVFNMYVLKIGNLEKENINIEEELKKFINAEQIGAKKSVGYGLMKVKS